ncbi:hypothetical protein P154DRAFT_565724 [Amniculicola lignicola CBS 123094]|uniref:F-box domain-containing protein n=1 Tax=Amniculicola lignicola CBS 123094 TaxID=1392246 RepID=A0A6A5W6F1_9PLEO|nr:hypothetical protein P154DRAFT_565724 [Amniculicola lignicola CBS 123094]
MTSYGTVKQWNAASGGDFAVLPCEIFDKILENLPFLDLWDQQAINRYWRDRLRYLMSFDHMKKRLHIIPVKSTEPDPHFYRDFMVTGDEGSRSLTIMATLAKLNHTLAKGIYAWTLYLSRHSRLRRKYIEEEDITETPRLRVFCRSCDTIHKRNHWEDVHPLLQPLQQFGVCFAGHGAERILIYGAVGDDSAHERLKKVQRLITMFEYLNRHIVKLKRCGEHTLTQPPCRRINVTDGYLGVKIRTAHGWGHDWITLHDTATEIYASAQRTFILARSTNFVQSTGERIGEMIILGAWLAHLNSLSQTFGEEMELVKKDRT